MEKNVIMCDVCKKIFKNKHGFEIHNTKKHNGLAIYREKVIKLNFKCICGKYFKSKNALSGHKQKCNIYKMKADQYYKSILTKDFLERNLIEKNYSANYISKYLINEKNKYFPINAGVIIRYAKKYGIKTKTLKEAAGLKTTIEQRKQTCLKRYGVDNPSKSEKIKKKKAQTFLKHYGIDNIFKDTEYIKQCMINKYGVMYSRHLPQYKGNNGRLSKPHLKISELLNKLNIEHENEKNGLFCGDYCPVPDIFIKPNYIIEIYGDYWHANPNYYKESDVFYTWEGKKTAKEIWEKDKKREKFFKNNGFNVIIIWEEELCNMESVIKKILNFLKL